MTNPNTLPTSWPMWPGEEPSPAHESAGSLLGLVSDAAADAEPILAQLRAAPDLTGTAHHLGVRLREQLAQAVVTAAALREMCPGAGG